ncbi:lipoyl(octanoyl) transferase LipB [Leucobacter aridicollis]|uniref:lipoyl(octanoyl) transferase LipB n=1 Tax=Leucobacter aridicollis TaxID=283878 RepID=UPI002167C5AC|nr:lipoyl(octanoyl) transferase LipB [Leucobacter aridicollis]MCS3427865.1 lipoyl(octanoyl) transferase [Leucobacter aridicollis]
MRAPADLADPPFIPSGSPLPEFSDLFPDLVPYRTGLALQQAAADRVTTGADSGTVMFLEHEPVFTAGRRAERGEYPTGDTPVVPVNRGGRVTWHGPGQLVAYPIIRLANGLGGADLVHAMEAALIATASEFGVVGHLIDGRTGVWVSQGPATGQAPPAKLAQIGIHVGRRIVTHGVALNCSNDLAVFETFTPCGISDAGVTSLTRETGRTVTPTDAYPALRRHLFPVIERFVA